MSARPDRRPAYGFFGGSFDPVQRAHIALARAALKERRLRAVYLVPAARSPFKSAGPQAAVSDRLALLRRAVAPHSGLRLGRWETGRPGPSYTYQTLRFLRQKFPNRRWEILLGEDAWAGVRGWRRWRDIVRHHTLVVARRSVGSSGRGPAAVFLKTAIPGMSSTAVRSALAQGRPVSALLPPGVGALVRSRGLYAGTSPSLAEDQILRKLLSPARYRHTRAVADWAEALARRHGADPARARRAGLWHDALKGWSRRQLLAYARRHGIRGPGLPLTRETARLWHGPAAAHWARRRGWVTDAETARAMARHTTGASRLGRLDKILFVADFSSADRRYPEARRVRRLALRDLDGALRETLKVKMIDVLCSGGAVPPPTLRLWNSLCEGRKRS